MGLFKKKETAIAATASVADENGNHQVDDTALGIAALERDIEQDPAASAALKLEQFDMTPGAKHLLDRAMDNLANNKGDGLDDEDARNNARNRAALISAAGNRLNVVIAALVGTSERPTDIAPALYSLCYNIVKAAGFVANLDMQRYLDPRGSFDLAPYVDRREDEPSAPDGLDNDVDRELLWLKEMYGGRVEDYGDVILRSFEDLRMFLQLTCEAYGGDPERIIPLAMVMRPDGGFDEIHDPQLALDHYEIKRQESRKRRNDRQAAHQAAAAAKAQEIVNRLLETKRG